MHSYSHKIPLLPPVHSKSAEEDSAIGCQLGWSLFLKIDLNFMDIKSCVLFTELGRIVVKSLVFYITKSTPRPTHLGGKTMDWEEFF